jgi:hypothetical protein
VKRQAFEELLGSVREAGAILRGRQEPSRRIVVRASGVRVIRERTGLSQRIIEHDPAPAVKAIHRT